MIYISVVTSYSSFVSSEELGKSPSAKYMYGYLRDLKARTVITEKEYVDGEFLRDYAKFYSRAYRSIPRYTTRYHFFSEEFTEDEFKKMLSDPSYLKGWLNKKGYRELEEIYLGFIVKKPVQNCNSQSLLGRTVVKTYPASSEEGYKRIFIKVRVPLSLFGIPLSVKTAPFINQDEGVGVCASAAIWMTNNPLSALFGIPPEQSLARITEIAHTHPGLNRMFPSQGLNILQVINYFKSQSLDTEVVNVKNKKPNSDFFMRFIKAFVDANMPLIVVLDMYHDKDEHPAGQHAAVITGYKFDPKNRRVVALYLHDDQIGPYAKVRFSVDDGGKSIECKYEKNNEWKEMGYRKIVVAYIIVPVYPKIRLAFSRVYKHADERLGGHVGYEYDISLKNVREYKYNIWNTTENLWWYNPDEKVLIPRTKWELLEMNMPRFLWIIKAYRRNRHIADVVLDATAVHPRVLFNVYYQTDNTTEL